LYAVVPSFFKNLLQKAGAGAVTNFHVLGSKPAPHAFVLEICVQAFGKGVVFARITDEAGGKLD
jgi:hypothetical protein